MPVEVRSWNPAGNLFFVERKTAVSIKNSSGRALSPTAMAASVGGGWDTTLGILRQNHFPAEISYSDLGPFESDCDDDDLEGGDCDSADESSKNESLNSSDGLEAEADEEFPSARSRYKDSDSSGTNGSENQRNAFRMRENRKDVKFRRKRGVV